MSIDPSQQEIDDFCLASVKGDAAAVIAFLDQYPHAVDFKSYTDSTALLCAVANNHEGLALLLLTRGASPDVPMGALKWTALMHASLTGYAEIVAEMLKKGAVIDREDASGGTALMCAARNGHTAVTALLLENGAHPDKADNNGNTAWAWAEMRDKPETAAFIRQWPEMKKQRLAAQKVQEDERAAIAARFKKLKQSQSAKPVLKRKGPHNGI